ncbi:MAG: lipid II:glycine glycyltransferase FemX [Pyrinomonadaceae bacterium]
MKTKPNGPHCCDQLQKVELFSTRWIDFVHSRPNASCFHHPAWAGLLTDCYGYQAFAMALTDDAGRIVAGLPVIEVTRPWGERRWVSLPFTDHCTPLASDDDALQTLVLNLIEAQKVYNLSSIAVRAHIRIHGAGDDSFNSRSDAFLHTLRLQPDAQSLFRRFNKTQVQRNILKAERIGVSVQWGDSLCDMEAFYSLHVGTRRRLGIPVQPKRFFDLLWEDILSAGLGFLLIVYKDDRPIAGAVFLVFNSVMIYKYGASNQKFLGLRPNNLLFWHAIRWGCDNGYHTLDFGRTDADNTGLRKFKNGWGTDEVPLVYSVVGSRPTKFSLDRGSKVMSGVIRCLPPWVCRATGELFYKYTA